MNRKTAVATILICGVALFAALEHGRAAAEPPGSPMKIGLVSIRGVFKGSKKHAQHSAQLMVEQNRVKTQLDELSKETQVEEAELKVLKQGTPDYMEQLQLVLEKRAKLQGQEDYIKQLQAMENKRWLEELYRETLKAVNDIAAEKGLDLVLERTEPEFPISGEELMAALNVHKVLYGGGCVDLTSEVIARIDASETLKP